MLDSVVLMQIKLVEVELVAPVRFIHEAGSEFRREEAERWREVEVLSDLCGEVFERYVATIMWQYGVVGERIEHGASGTRVVFARRHVCGPFAVVAWAAFRDDVTGLVLWGHEVDEEDNVVPADDNHVD